MRPLKQLADQNGPLKNILTDLMLDREMVMSQPIVTRAPCHCYTYHIEFIEERRTKRADHILPSCSLQCFPQTIVEISEA